MAATPSTPARPGLVKLETVRQEYEKLALSSSEESVSFDQVLISDNNLQRLEGIQRFNSRLMATKAESPTGHIFINGKHAPMGGVCPILRTCKDMLMQRVQAMDDDGAVRVDYTARSASGAREWVKIDPS